MLIFNKYVLNCSSESVYTRINEKNINIISETYVLQLKLYENKRFG